MAVPSPRETAAEPPSGSAPANVSGAIYGQVLVTSVLAAASEDPGATPGDLLADVLATMLVFWAAHVYADAMSHRVESGGHLPWAQLRAIMVREWPIVQAAGASSVVLGLGALGVFSRDGAVSLAIALGLVALFGWGLVVARRSGRGLARSLLSAVLSAAFGLVIVALKLIVH